jgi:hypothetical protein
MRTAVNVTIEDLLKLLGRKARTSSIQDSEPVYYLQSQNGNLSDELVDLAEDVGNGNGPSFATEMFGAAQGLKLL